MQVVFYNGRKMQIRGRSVPNRYDLGNWFDGKKTPARLDLLAYGVDAHKSRAEDWALNVPENLVQHEKPAPLLVLNRSESHGAI